MTRAERRKLHARQSRAWRARIRKALRDATPEQRYVGIVWYGRAHAQVKDAAERHGVSLRAMAGAVAAISPGLAWERNVLHAEQLAAYVNGRGQRAFGGGIKRPAVPTYSHANVEKALACLRGAEPTDYVTGPKVSAFYRLLVNPQDNEACCIDGHAIMLVRDTRQQLRSAAGNAARSEQARIQDAYRAEARRCGLLPNQVQAICWLVQKARATEDVVPF